MKEDADIKSQETELTALKNRVASQELELVCKFKLRTLAIWMNFCSDWIRVQKNISYYK